MRKTFRSLFPLWWRYFFRSHLTLVIACIFLAYSLFVFIDLVTHGKEFLDKDTNVSVWATYYISMFFYRLDTLIPFSIATATAILIPKLIATNELLPLFNAGISLRTIIRPFVTVSLLAIAFLYGNFQYIYPIAMQKYHECSDSDFGKESVKEEEQRLGIVLFKEGTRLFFKDHNTENKTLSDVFWVRSADCVLHIEKLHYFPDRHPDGHGVDVIERAASGLMTKTATYPFCELPELNFTRKTLRLATADPRELSLLQLASLSSSFGKCSSQRATETHVTLWTKLLTPLLALFAFLLPLPLCFRFERRFPQAFLVFFSIGALFLFLLLTQAFTVLARVPLVPTVPVIIFPWALFLTYLWRSRPSKI